MYLYLIGELAGKDCLQYEIQDKDKPGFTQSLIVFI